MKLATVLDFDQVLGLKLGEKISSNLEISDEVKSLLELRAEARKNKNFAESDRLRDLIKGMGFEVKDTQKGQELSKI